MQFIDLQAIYQQSQVGIDAAIKKVLAHGRYVMGPEIAELEQKLASFVGVKHAILTSSGTAALGVSLMALGIGPGDEVITPAFSFFATAEVVALLGARPVFIDIDPCTYNLDTHQLEQAITPNTRAIMPVSLYGQVADLDRINAIANQHGLPVVEDAAQSFGATHRGCMSGALSTIGCTSFFPSKPLGCFGDGGACFTDDDNLSSALRCIMNHGQDSRYNHVRLGINGRMDSIQAAVLIEKLKTFPEQVDARQQVAKWYAERLPAALCLPKVLDYNKSVYAQYTVQVEQRDKVVQALQQQGIPTAVHYPKGLHQQPAMTRLGYVYPACPVTESVASKVMSLPFHPFMSEQDVDRVAQALSSLDLIREAV